MSNLTDGTNLTGTITLSKATGTKVTLDTDHKYITKDIELTIDAPTSTITSSGATVSYTSGWVNAGSTTVTDTNLVAGNIKNGVSIFGVTGNYANVVIIQDSQDSNGGTIRTITTDNPIYVDTLNVTSNGQYVAPTDHYYSTVNVNVAGGSGMLLQEKTGITPTESSQTITADAGYGGLSSVQINAISSTYVGSGITSRNSSSLTSSGLTVTAPAGYYSSAATKTLTDSNLVAGNIKSGVSIFGVTGSYTGGGVSLQAKTGINPSTSSQTITADDGYDGLSSVQINAMPSITLPTSAAASATSGYTSKATISRSTSDQYINIPTGYNSAGAYYKISAVTNGSATAPATISGTSATISTGTGTLTLTKTISVTPSVTEGYISSGTAGNSSVSLTASVTINPTPTASGATVTIPAGYYSSQTTKSVDSITLPTSAAASATSGYTSKATISRSTSDQYINIPTGYNSAGAYYKINAVANGSATGPSSLSGTSASVSTGTNTLTLTKTGVTTTPTVSAGYVSSATASTATVTLTASVTTKAATDYMPSTSDNVIASGTYLTGNVTIKAVVVSGLSADTILSGTTVKIGDTVNEGRIANISGSVVIQHYYTGTSVPSSSTGENGDIYLKTS